MTQYRHDKIFYIFYFICTVTISQESEQEKKMWIIFLVKKKCNNFLDLAEAI